MRSAIDQHEIVLIQVPESIHLSAVLRHQRLAQRVGAAAIHLNAHILVGHAIPAAYRQRTSIDLRLVPRVLSDAEQSRRERPVCCPLTFQVSKATSDCKHRQSGGEQFLAGRFENAAGQPLVLRETVVAASEKLVANRDSAAD